MQKEQKIHPFKCPQAEVRSEWREKELWWIINGKEVSDTELRRWCNANLDYPWNHVDVVRAYNTNAWAYYHQENKHEHDPTQA